MCSILDVFVAVAVWSYQLLVMVMPKSVCLSSWIRARFSPKTPGGTAWFVIIKTCNGGKCTMALAYLFEHRLKPFNNSAACQTEIRLSCPVVPADMGVSMTTPRTPVKLGQACLKAYRMSSLLPMPKHCIPCKVETSDETRLLPLFPHASTTMWIVLSPRIGERETIFKISCCHGRRVNPSKNAFCAALIFTLLYSFISCKNQFFCVISVCKEDVPMNVS